MYLPITIYTRSLWELASTIYLIRALFLPHMRYGVFINCIDYSDLMLLYYKGLSDNANSQPLITSIFF